MAHRMFKVKSVEEIGEWLREITREVDVIQSLALSIEAEAMLEAEEIRARESGGVPPVTHPPRSAK